MNPNDIHQLPDGRVLHTPANLLRVDRLYAFLSVDEDGNEGLCAAPLNGMTMPLIAADRARMESLVPVAQELARLSGRKVRLVEFSTRTELCVISHGH